MLLQTMPSYVSFQRLSQTYMSWSRERWSCGVLRSVSCYPKPTVMNQSTSLLKVDTLVVRNMFSDAVCRCSPSSDRFDNFPDTTHVFSGGCDFEQACLRRTSTRSIHTISIPGYVQSKAANRAKLLCPTHPLACQTILFHRHGEWFFQHS